MLQKTQQLVLDLLRADSLERIISITETHIRENFDVEHFQLLLLGSAHWVEQQSSLIMPIEAAEQAVGSLLNNNQSYCGSLRELEIKYLFQCAPEKIGSAAIATHAVQFATTTTEEQNPGPTLILAVGHTDPSHYNNDTGTVFLDYLAEVLSALISKQLCRK